MTNEVTVNPDPELENLMNRVMPLLNGSKRWQNYKLWFINYESWYDSLNMHLYLGGTLVQKANSEV